MATTRNTDVNLIIRARNEADKAIDSVADSLQRLFDNADESQVGVADLAKTLGALDKAASAIGGSMDKANAAVDRQRSSLAESNAQYASLLRQQAEAKRVLDSFGNQGTKGFVGPRTEDFTKNYEGVRAEVERLGAAISNLFTKINTQSAQLGGTQSALLKLAATSESVAQGQAVAEARIELTTQALREQAEAAERVTAIQQQINRVTGVTRAPATRAADSADLLLQADNQFRAREAADLRDAEIAHKLFNERVKQGVEALREHAAAQERDEQAARKAAQAYIDAATRRDGERRGEANQIIARNDPIGAAQSDYDKSARRVRELQSTGFLNSDQAAAEQQRLADALKETISALDGTAAAEKKAKAEADGMDEEVRQLRAALDPLAAIQDRFNTALARYRVLAGAGKLGADELAKAEKHLADEADRARRALEGTGNTRGANGKIGLFGLKPYELQNLSYQVNDVVTGLASGQRLGQVVAQQGGQILQLFPKASGVIIGALSNPAVLGAIATFGLIAVAIGRAADEGDRLRNITARLTLDASGSLYDPQELEASAKNLRNYGASIEDATDAVKVFQQAQIDPSRIDQFGRAAQNLADVTGTKLPEAAKRMADGFTGGFDAVAKLDDELNFLTATQRQSIQQAFEDGRAQEARAQAFGILNAKLEASAAIQRGPAAQASRDLNKAYNDLMDSIAASEPVQAAIGLFGELARAISQASGNAGAFNNPADRLKRIAELRTSIAAIEKDLASLRSYGPAQFADDIAHSERILKSKQQELGQLQDQVRRERASAAQTGDTHANDPNGTAAKQRNEALRRISAEEELQRLRDAGQRRILTAQEQARRAELAGNEAARNVADTVVAAAERRRAVSKETAAIERESEARGKEAARERERLAKQTQFIDPVNGRISSGFGPRKSPGGVGSTFHKGIDYAVPAGTSVKAPAAGVVVETGYDSRLGRYVLIDHGNKTQSKFGHLSDNSVVRSGQTVEQGQLIGKSGNTGSATTGAHLHYTVLVNGKPVDPKKGIFVGDGPSRFETNQGEALQDYDDALEDRQHRQDNFNLSLKQEAEDRQRAIDALREQQGLYGTELLAAERRQAQIRAELELRQDVENQNKNLAPGLPPIVVSDEQVAKARELAGALFDVQNARAALDARRDDAQRPLDTLEQQRDLLREQAEFLRSIGENGQADAVDEQIVRLGGDIGLAYDALMDFYRALSPDERVQFGIVDDAQLDNIIAKLGQAKQASQEWDKVLGVEGKQIAQALAGAAANALNSFIERVATGQNVFKALGQSVREFAANFISSIAQALVQLLAFAAAVQVLRALGVPIPVGVGVGQHHTGGIAGSAGGVRRQINPALFQTALRYHTGGIVGLAPDEVPAILKRGEEVLTQGDPRHRFARDSSGGGSSSTQPAPINIVNTFDREEAAEMLLRTRAGERTILNLIRDNPGAFRAAMG